MQTLTGNQLDYNNTSTIEKKINFFGGIGEISKLLYIIVNPPYQNINK